MADPGCPRVRAVRLHSRDICGRPRPGAGPQGLSGPGLGAQGRFPSAALSAGNCCRQLVSSLNSWTHFWGPASWPGSACQGPAGCHPRRQGGGHLQFQWPPCFWAEKSDRPPNWLGSPPCPSPSPSQVTKTVRCEPLPITAPWRALGREETKAAGTYLGRKKVLAGAGGRCPGGEQEPAGLPAPWAALLSSPAPSAARCCPGAVVAAVAVAGEGAGVCARPEPLQHLCIKMCSSLFQALLTGWLQSSANALRGPGDGFLLPPSHPLPVPTLPALPHLLSFKD